MRRKLSTIEHLIDGNITYVVGLEGHLAPERLRSALARVQRKHPALRMLISETGGKLFYEMDAAKDIPLRVVECGPGEHAVEGRAVVGRAVKEHAVEEHAIDEDTIDREALAEVTTAFAHDQPQLRVAWLRHAAGRSELLVTAQHRICDGMSMLTIVRELLRALHSDEELIPYAPITTDDIIGELDNRSPADRSLHDRKRWKRKLAAGLVNALLALVPPSRRPLQNREIHLEWSASQALSSALRRRCKAEDVSIHAALLMVLSEALANSLGKDMPDWIECPVDARRGRLSALESDMLFFGGGSFKVEARQESGNDFWERAREMSRQIRLKVEQDVAEIPARYQLCEMLDPPSPGKIRSIVRLGDALSRNANWNRFSFSNLGNLVLDDEAAPVRVRRFSLHVHSFATRILGLIAFSLHGQLHFIYTGDEKCLDRSRADALGREFMTLLEKHVGQSSEASKAERGLVARTDADAMAG